MFSRQEETSTYGLGDLVGAVGGYLGLFIGNKRRLYSSFKKQYFLGSVPAPSDRACRLVLLPSNGGAYSGHSQGQGGPGETAILIKCTNSSKHYD